MIQRRNTKAPPSQGGWNAFVTTLTGTMEGLALFWGVRRT